MKKVRQTVCIAFSALLLFIICTSSIASAEVQLVDTYAN